MTSLKVAVRVRPLGERETHVNSRVVVDVHGKDIVVTDLKVPVHHGYDHRARVHRFSFDYCFWSVDPLSTRCASQTTVYEDLGRVVLEALLQGYNSCIVAYGQSGSGKTYTMMGTKAEIGLTPRICQGLFTKLTDLNDHHLSFQVDISFMEIYNEQVYDLLQKYEVGSNNNNNSNRKKPRLKIREHPVHGPFVEGLSTHLVRNIDTVCGLIARGNENRVNAATHVHDRSSRSHAIFTIRCSQACLNESQPREVVSKLHLVDLAGSERAGPEFCHSRIKEGANINKSLVTLGNVISALVELSQRSRNGSTTGRQPYVPYRDSNLTWLLKDSLGGNSHTFMIAAVSPSNECYSETLSTLRYAQRAKNVLNRPVVNEDPATKIINDLRVEVMKLKSLLASAELVSKRVLISPVPDVLKLNTILRESEERANLLTKSWFEKWIETYNVVLKCPGCSETVSDQLNIAINTSSKELLENENSLQDDKLKKQNDDESREENGVITVWNRENQDENLKHDSGRNFELTQSTEGQICSKDLNLLALNDTYHDVDVKEELDRLTPLTVHESEEIINVDIESTASSECCILPNEIILYSRKKLHRPLRIDSCCVLSLEDLHIPSVIQKHSVLDECDVRNDSCALHSDDGGKEKCSTRIYINHKECSSVTDIPPITNYLSFSTPNLQYPYHSYEYLRRCRSVPYNLHRPSCRYELNNLRSMKEIGRSVTVSELAYTKERSIDRSNSESSHSRSQTSTQEDTTLTKSELSSEIIDCKGFASETTENSISDDETQSINDDGFCNIDTHTDNVQNLQYDATECSKECPEISFSDRVTEESFNVVDFLNKLEQEDMEGMKPTFYSSQVRRDSEMWSLLSFSSSDCPFRDSADNFLSGSEEAAEQVEYSNHNESGLTLENNNRSMQDSFPSSWASDDSDDSSEELEFEYVDFRNKVCKNPPELIAIKEDYSSNANKCFSKFSQDMIPTRPRLECTLEVAESIPSEINGDERMKSFPCFPCTGKSNKLSPVFEEENILTSKIVVNNSMEVMENIGTITKTAEFNRNLEEKASEKDNSASNSETVDNPMEIPSQEMINRGTLKTTIELNEQVLNSRNRSNVELNHNERLESKENEMKNSIDDVKDEILTPDQEISLKEEIHRNNINEIEKDIEKLINDIDLTDSDDLAAVLLGETPENAERTGISSNFEARMEMLLTAIDGKKSDTLNNISKFSTNDLFQTDKEIEELIKSAHIGTCSTNSVKHLLKSSDERNYDLTRNKGSRSLKGTQQNLERIWEEESSLENIVAGNLSHHEMNSLEASTVKSNQGEEIRTSLINIHFAKENVLDEFEMEGTLIDEKVIGNSDTVEIRHSSDLCPDNTSEQKLETSVQCFQKAEKNDNYLSKAEMQEISSLEKAETSDDCSTDICDFEGEFSERESEECISIPSVSINYDPFISPNHVSLPPIPEEEKDDEEEDVALVGESQNNSFMMDSLENPDVSLWENRYLQDNRTLLSSNDQTKQLLKGHTYPYPCLKVEEKISASEAFAKGEFFPNNHFNTKEKLDGETKPLTDDQFYAHHSYNTEGKSDGSEAKTLLNSYAHHCYKEEVNSETNTLFNGLSYALHSNREKEKEKLNAEMLAADPGSNLTDYDNADDEEKIDRLLRSLNIKFRDFGHLNSLEQKSGSWDSSKSSSSSDSITYVFVGKDHDEKTNNTNIDTNSSSLYSSLLSSVSLDSLEKSSFPPQISCPSPRTLSIDSLIAEEMLFQLRNAESQTSPQNCANHQESVIQQNKPESFRLVQSSPYDGADERTEAKLINNKCELDLADRCDNAECENYYSKDLSQTYDNKESNEVQNANIPKNNNSFYAAPSGLEEFSEKIMPHLDGQTPCFPMANESCCDNSHENNNETETSLSQEEPTTKSYPFSEIVTETEISLDSEFDDEQGSVLLPPPSSFDNSRYSQDISSTSEALESIEEEERAKNKSIVMISKSTQTDSFPESQRHASTETVESSRQTELVMSMMQLMLETVKLLKVERKQHVCASPFFVQSVDESQVKSVKRRLDFPEDVLHQTCSSTDSTSKTFSDGSSCLNKHCEMNSRAYDGNNHFHIRDSFNERKFHTLPRHGRFSTLTEDVLQANIGCNETKENYMYGAETCLNSTLKDESHSFTLPREYRKNRPRHQDQLSQLSITKSPRTDFQNHVFPFPLPSERENIVQNHIVTYGDNISETPYLSQTLKKMRMHNLSPNFSPSLERKISSDLSPSFSPSLERNRTSDLSPNFSPPLERKRTSDLSPSLSPPLGRKRTSDLSPSLSPSLGRARTSDLSPLPLGRERSNLSPSFSLSSERKRIADFSPSLSPTSSLDQKIPSPPTSTSSRSSSWSKKSSLKEHLNRLIEVRRRVVEATKSPKSYKIPNSVDGSNIEESLEKTKEYLCNNLAVESMFEKGLMDTDSKISPSSSSEGYLSSVSSRGVRRQFSEESTDSHGSNSLMNGLKALEEKDTQCLMTSLDLRGLHQHDAASPSSRWHHTSTDSGAFFMDSPATCKKDDLPVETGKGSSGQACRMGVRRKETSSVSKPHTSSRKHEANHLTTSNGILTSYKPETIKNCSPSFSKPGTSCKDTSHYKRRILAGEDSPGFRDLDEIGDIYKVIQRKTESKYGTSSSNENSRSSSLSPYMDHNLVKSSTESISDTNWQLTRSDAYRRLAAFEIDKSRLRMKDYVAEGSYSATSSLRSQSSLVSDEDLFSYDSYMSLPSPRLYLSPSPASPYCPIT